MDIVVIGGVAAGMSAAARMRRHDERANIIVFEAGDYVSFANCGLPYHLGGDIESRNSLLLHSPESLKIRANLDVRTGSRVMSIDRDTKMVAVQNRGEIHEVHYDKLLLATGARGIIPPIKGIDLPQVLQLRTIPEMDSVIELAGMAKEKAMQEGRKARAVVVGGGFIGLETVEAFAQRGFEVTVVDAADHLLPPVDQDLAPYIDDELKAHGIDRRVGVSVEEFRAVGNNEVEVVCNEGGAIRADVVVMSVGVVPETQLAKEAGLTLGDNGAIVVNEFQQTSDSNIWAVGDAAQISTTTGRDGSIMLAGPANRQGRTAADAMFGKAHVKRAPILGTAVVKVFDQIVAITGANRGELDAAGKDYFVVRLHPTHHVSYYPGAEAIHMLGFFEEESGKMLGAQAVGKAGADKRIDVLATAIRAGMTADELTELELTYSPPVGAAKDPVNMLGFVTQNHLDKFVLIHQPDDLKTAREQGIILDVRNHDEVRDWALQDSLKIPLGQLRNRIDEVREAAAGRLVFVHCASGIRSYLAARILINAGMDARNIAGGQQSLEIVGRRMDIGARKDSRM